MSTRRNLSFRTSKKHSSKKETSHPHCRSRMDDTDSVSFFRSVHLPCVGYVVNDPPVLLPSMVSSGELGPVLYDRRTRGPGNGGIIHGTETPPRREERLNRVDTDNLTTGEGHRIPDLKSRVHPREDPGPVWGCLRRSLSSTFCNTFAVVRFTLRTREDSSRPRSRRNGNLS